MLVKYKGIYEKRLIEGVLKCTQVEEAKNALSNNGIRITTCKEISYSYFSKFKKKLSFNEIHKLFKQWANLNAVGMTPQETLKIIAFNQSNTIIRRYLFSTMLQMYFGHSMKESFDISGEVNGVEIDKFCLEMIDIAEISGNLKTVINDLCEYYEAKAEFKSKIKLGTIYPKIVLVVGIVLMIAILTFILPSYKELFVSMDIEIPFFTSVLFQISSFFSKYVLFIILLVCILIFGIMVLKKKIKNLRFIEKIKCRINLYKNVTIMNISSTLKVLLGSNVPLSKSLSFTKTVIENYYYKIALQNIIESVNEGEELSISIGRHEVFNKEFCELVSIGEASGLLKESFKDINTYYNEMVKEKLKKLIALIEPISIIVVSIIMIVMILMLFLPLTNITNSQLLK